MSKSRGTGISPQRYLELGMNPEWLRYYIAAKLNDRVEDLDFNPDDFIARVNSDLVGKYVNIASRAAPFLARHFGGELATKIDDESRDRLAHRPTMRGRDRAPRTTSARVRPRDARSDGARRPGQRALRRRRSRGSSPRIPANARRAASRRARIAAGVQAC